MFDQIIENGTIIDGSGEPRYDADIGIVGDRVVAIGDLREAQAGRRIDARGAIVSPGFVDLHTHSDFTLLVNGKAESQVHQGVTFEAVGNCGHSCAPVIGDPAGLKRAIVGHHPSVEITWRTFAEYLERLEQSSLGINVAAYVGHGPLRIGVLRGEQRPATVAETKQMESLLDQCLDEGAIGFSTGLEYSPGNSARTEEVLALAKVTQKHNLVYATHVRNRDYFYEQGIGEALSVARLSGVKTQLSHITTKFGAPPRANEHALEMIQWSRDSGCDIGFDAIPHEWGPTLLSAVLPPWAFEGGIEQIHARLRDAKMREDIKGNPLTIWKLVHARRWDQLIFFGSHANKDLVGLTFEEIGKRRGCDPYDAILDLLLEEGDGFYGATWVGHLLTESDLKMTMEHRDCAIMSDTVALAPYGELGEVKFAPASYGWVARWLGLYARDQRLVSLEEAVRKITSLPAKRLGLKQRGHLRVGCYADVSIFDFDSLEDRSSIANPNVYPSGIRHVMVNGQLAVENGTRTNVNAGRVVRGTD
ncbi:MAG: amidohydrolase family protein [Planctomycetota bacterium]|nr:amidohydrolase family protein [Planctomycetota bacterium]